MRRLFLTVLVVFAILAVPPSAVLAQHQHGGTKSEPMKMDSKEVLVEGVKAVFQVMTNQEHKKMLADMKMKEQIEAGTTHNITIVLVDNQTQKEITNAAVKMKVIDPAGKDQIKPLKVEKEMKSYDGYFNLPAKGKYQILISFKVGEKTRTAGIYYDVK
ncbi:MAG: FixH family protein [Thermodesulfobacteriota bacterium]